MYLHAKNYQNIPSGLNVRDFHKLITDGPNGHTTLKRRINVTSTLIRRHFDIVCLLGMDTPQQSSLLRNLAFDNFIG